MLFRIVLDADIVIQGKVLVSSFTLANSGLLLSTLILYITGEETEAMVEALYNTANNAIDKILYFKSISSIMYEYYVDQQN